MTQTTAKTFGVKKSIRDIADSKDAFPEHEIADYESKFANLLSMADLEYVNAAFAQQKVRQLSHRDFAIIYMAVKKNVTTNTDGRCGGKSVIGFTKTQVATPYHSLNISRAIKMFIRWELMVIATQGHKGRDARYKMI